MKLDKDFYMIVADFGVNGVCFLEADVFKARTMEYVLETIDHHPENVIKVYKWNPYEGTSQDCSFECASAWWDARMDDFDLRSQVLPELVMRNLDDLRSAA